MSVYNIIHRQPVYSCMCMWWHDRRVQQCMSHRLLSLLALGWIICSGWLIFGHASSEGGDSTMLFHTTITWWMKKTESYTWNPSQKLTQFQLHTCTPCYAPCASLVLGRWYGSHQIRLPACCGSTQQQWIHLSWELSCGDAQGYHPKQRGHAQCSFTTSTLQRNTYYCKDNTLLTYPVTRLTVIQLQG